VVNDTVIDEQWTSKWPALIVVGHLVAIPARADDNEVSLHWKNTLRYTAAVRTEKPKTELLADANADDGDRNFRRGLLSNRADLLSELNIAVGDIGLEVSGAAWYDTIYNHRTDNNSAFTLNTRSNGVDHFARPTRRLHGRNAELLTAFASANVTAGDMPVSLRVGRAHLQWGESLFFAENGIASGQTPIDAIKALSVPSSTAKEVFMPVTQVWASVQPAANITVEGYYQLEWRKSRLPGSGSYFNTADFLDAGGERLIAGPGQFFRRSADQGASGSGQYGLALRVNTDTADYGFYALRSNAKDPQVYLRLGPFLGTRNSASQTARERTELYGVSPTISVGGTATTTNNVLINYGLYGDPSTGEVGTYNLAYPQGIQIYGASFSSYAGDTAIAGEVSVRRHTPLVSSPIILFQNIVADNKSTPRYAVGDSLHAQLSTVVILPQSGLWQGAALSTELAFNSRLSVTQNHSALDTARNRSAAALRTQFEPQYFAVLPGLDISVPMGFGVGVVGRSSINQGQNVRTGDMEIGVRAIYRSVWEGSVRFTHFVGGPKRQAFADRDFISLSLKRAL